MSNSVGVIFHEDWKEFSPFLYSHYGADTVPFYLQNFIREYYKKWDIKDEKNTHDGHKYNPCHMMVGFLQSIDKDIHIRVENLDEYYINKLIKNHEYDNCFSGGCWIVNVSIEHYGETVIGNGYCLDNDNLLLDKLKNEYNNDDGWY
jgi:hypothetical protein